MYLFLYSGIYCSSHLQYIQKDICYPVDGNNMEVKHHAKQKIQFIIKKL